MPKTKGKKAKSNFDIYEHVTNQMVAALEQGIVPWHKPWKSLGGEVHRNLSSKRPYRGINIFILDTVAAMRGYQHPLWLTAKQVKEKGGEILDSEKYGNGGPGSTLVTFWKPMVTKVEEDGEEKRKTWILLKFYQVWNIAQTTIEPPEVEELPEFDHIEAADDILNGYCGSRGPNLQHRGNSAFYAPLLDTLTTPEPEAFDTPEDYYQVAYHECVHSTGHEKRLHRVKDWSGFGSEPYAREELVAEMGSSMLAGVAGIEPNYQQSAAYITSWLKALKDDKKLVIIAAAQAQKASDYILGIKHEEAKSEPTNGETA